MVLATSGQTNAIWECRVKLLTVVLEQLAPQAGNCSKAQRVSMKIAVKQVFLLTVNAAITICQVDHIYDINEIYLLSWFCMKALTCFAPKSWWLWMEYYLAS